MAKYLVTGGAGFIGSHIVRELVRRGHKVKVIDNLSTGKIENLQDVINKIKFIKGDICNLKLLEKEFKGIDFILHQAASCSVPDSIKFPKIYHKNNIDGTLNLLQAAVKNKIKKIVFASTSAIYGESDRFPSKEHYLPKLISPYALSKLAGEYYCQIFAKHYNLSVICLRYFNVFGPNQASSKEYTLIIPKFIDCFLKDLKPPIFGDGQQSRDYIYVDNVVNANILAANSRLKYGVFNVGTGKDYSVLQIVKHLNKIFNKKIKPNFLPPRPGDVLRTQAEISKIVQCFGFKIKIDFETGLEKTITQTRKDKRI